jgi:2-keto-3-deoxy-6-phosphogluconate aldolase
MVPVLRLPSAELTERAVLLLQEAGFATVEITMTTPDAVALIKKTKNAGAGTVLDLDTAQRKTRGGQAE